VSVGPLRLTLLVPGLLGSTAGAGTGAPGAAGPRRTAQQTLLNRARRLPEPADVEALRYRLFGYALSESHDHPDAWLSYQTDTGLVAPGALLRADPVHLRADLSRLLLFDAAQLRIAPEEAQALAETFNRHYAADGLRLEFPLPARGYLHLPRQPDLRTTPLAQAIGRDVDAHLPAGHEARDWHRFLNEVQMLFHDHPVNRAREAHGRPPINSLWLWGGGRPLAAMASGWQHVWCADPVVKGLARLNGIGYSPPPADATAWLREAVGDRHLLCLDDLRQAVAYGDAESWYTQSERLEQVWFAPLLVALRRGRLRELTLYPDDGRKYRVTRWDLWKFWRGP
jgi:hypothetical protein